MRLTIAELDVMPHDQAARAFASCCGSSAWVDAMLTSRPFGNRGALLSAAEEAASSLSESDWLEMFAHHPRIGERQVAAATSPTAREWAMGEQAAASVASDAAQRELVERNAEYEERFGFIFIICASGRSAAEILAVLKERLHHEREAELGVAAGEQRAITRLRLEKLLGLPNDDGERR